MHKFSIYMYCIKIVVHKLDKATPCCFQTLLTPDLKMENCY